MKLQKQTIHFTILTFFISWLLWIPLLFWSDSNPEFFFNTDEIPALLIIIQTLGAAAPSIAAIILIKNKYGKESLEKVFKKYTEWRNPIIYILSSILILPIVHILALLLIYLLEGPVIWDYESTPIGEIVNNSGWIALFFTLPIVFITNLLSSPLLEELGWRGFLLPKLQEKYSAFTSSILTGTIWGLWHLPLWLIYEENILVSLVMIILTAIIYTWLFNSTRGSMLIVLFFHSSANVALNLINIPSYLGTEDFKNLPIYQIIILFLVVLILVVSFGTKNLSNKSKYKFEDTLKKD